MSLQTREPIEHVTLNPSFMPVTELVGRVKRGELDLDPPYQRGRIWTPDQRVGLVLTWLRGLPAGVVILSDRCSHEWTSAHPDMNPNTNADEPWWACIDGKQRISTAVEWFDNRIAVPASWLPTDHVETTEKTGDGPYVRHRDLTRKGQRLFDRHAALLIAETRQCATLADEAALYLLVNDQP